MRAWFVALFLVAAAFAFSGNSAGTHWCAETTAVIAPDTTVAGLSTRFQITLRNGGIYDTTLTSVVVSFSWDPGSPQTLGGGPLPAGGSRDFTVFATTPPSTGSYGVDVTFTGTNEGDTSGQPVTCPTSSLGITIISGFGGSIFSGIILIMFIIAAIVIVLVVVLALVLHYATKRKQPSMPLYGPPYQPPYQPPYRPPMEPPQPPSPPQIGPPPTQPP